MKHASIMLAFAGALFLTGCEDEAEPVRDQAETGGRAAGEVLGGTISDDMLPLERLTSNSPPAEGSQDADEAEAQETEGGETE